MTDRNFDRDERRPYHAVQPGPFRLYPEERHWWSYNDYAAVLSAVEYLRHGPAHAPRDPARPFSVLEFGPGSSTLSLIEGGATSIDTCEDNPDWEGVYRTRLEGKYPDIVHLHAYEWADPLTIPAIDGQRFDLGLVDGPLGTDRRGAVVRYCLDHCEAVLVPTEDANPAFRQELLAIAEALDWSIDIHETGPLSGGFALLQKPRRAAAPGEHAEHGHPVNAQAPTPAPDNPDAPDPATRAVDPADLRTPEMPSLEDDGVPPLMTRAPRLKRRKKPDPERA